MEKEIRYCRCDETEGDNPNCPEHRDVLAAWDNEREEEEPIKTFRSVQRGSGWVWEARIGSRCVGVFSERSQAIAALMGVEGQT